MTHRTVCNNMDLITGISMSPRMGVQEVLMAFTSDISQLISLCFPTDNLWNIKKQLKRREYFTFIIICSLFILNSLLSALFLAT